MKQKSTVVHFIFALCCLSACDFENPFFDPLLYTVIFDAYGWEPGISTATCMPGENVALPSPNPTRDSHVFGGWYTEKEGGGTQFTEKTSVNADTRVYARWIKEEDAVTVTFDADSGKPVPAKIVRARGETVVSLPGTNPSRDGYVFEGWYTEKEGGGTQFTASTPVNADITVYAKWVLYQHVTFDADGGKPAKTTASCPSGYTVKLPSDPTRTDYVFEGWYTEKEGGGTQFTASTQVNADITVYAKWTPYLRVTFDPDGGTPTSIKTCAPGATVRLPAVPTRADYTFDGWYTEKDGRGRKFTSSTRVDENITVYAKWKPYQHVTFDADGGEPAETTKTCASGTTVALPPNPTRAGYVFYGWYTEKDGGGTQLTAKTVVTRELTVYARWVEEPLVLKVTFNADGGAPASVPIMCIKGETLEKLPVDPTKDAHTFDGWYTGMNGGGTQFTASTQVNADITVYAKWTPYPVVTFDPDDGTPTSTKTCAPGTTVALPSNPTRTGYVFDGWYTEQNGGGAQFTASTQVNADITVYAKWTPYPVVTFDADYGVPAISTVSCAPGATVALPSPNPTRDGYVFDGWYTEKDGRGAQFTASSLVTEDITVYAKWLLNLTMNGTLELGISSIRFPNTGSMSLQKGAALTIVLSGSNVDWSGATWGIKVDAESVPIIGNGASRIWAVPPDTKNGQYTVTVMIWIGSTLYVGNFPILITN